MMSDTYPPVSFHFRLLISGQPLESSAGFSEVSGISKEFSIQEISDDEENRFKFRVPTSVKARNLILTRGLMSQKSELAKWCMKTLNDATNVSVEPKTIVVDLMGENGIPIRSWMFANAIPVKWSISE